LVKAADNIDKAEVRSRQMSRKLKFVEALPTDAAQTLLGLEEGSADETDV
jgi:DNA recombination protein RmuC